MPEFEHTREPESTPEQAETLLKLVEELTAKPPNQATYGTHGLGKEKI